MKTLCEDDKEWLRGITPSYADDIIEWVENERFQFVEDENGNDSKDSRG